jgi:hypothetical protein
MDPRDQNGRHQGGVGHKRRRYCCGGATRTFARRVAIEPSRSRYVSVQLLRINDYSVVVAGYLFLMLILQ